MNSAKDLSRSLNTDTQDRMDKAFEQTRSMFDKNLMALEDRIDK